MTLKHWVFLVFTILFAATGALDAWLGWKTPANTWFYLSLVCLFGAQFMAFRDVAGQRDVLRVKHLPRLRFVGIEQNPFGMFANGKEIGSAVGFKLCVVNDPELSSKEAIASDIRAVLTFVFNGAQVLEIDGRWDETLHPKQFEPKAPLATTTLQIGERRGLMVVVKFIDDASAYAYNSVSYDYPGMRPPSFRLPEAEYRVVVRIRGAGVDATTHLLLKQSSDDESPHLSMVSHQERPKELNGTTI